MNDNSSITSVVSILLCSITAESTDVISQAENKLNNLLSDNNKSICNNIINIIKSISEYEFPENWPQLIQYLLNNVTNTNNHNLYIKLGSLQCFSELCDILEEKELIFIAPKLF